MVESLSSASIKSKESDTSEVRWERKFGSVLVICWCAVFVSSKTKNVTSFLNTHLTKLDNLRLLMKFLKICKSVKTKGHMTVKEVLSFWTTLERQDLMTQVLKVNQKAIQMMMILVLTRKATEIRRNSSKSILIISERFYVFINLF